MLALVIQRWLRNNALVAITSFSCLGAGAARMSKAASDFHLTAHLAMMMRDTRSAQSVGQISAT
jgi:hypothetical protein